MKYKYLFLLFTLLICSCTSQNKQEDNTTSSEDNSYPQYNATNADSTRVAELISEFMDLAKSGEYDKAIDKIRLQDEKDIYADPAEFSEESRKGLKAMLQFNPIYDYKIEDYTFKTASETQITVSIKVADFEGNDSGRRSKLAFYPVCYVGNWILCMRQSSKALK